MEEIREYIVCATLWSSPPNSTSACVQSNIRCCYILAKKIDTHTVYLHIILPTLLFLIEHLNITNTSTARIRIEITILTMITATIGVPNFESSLKSGKKIYIISAIVLFTLQVD